MEAGELGRLLRGKHTEEHVNASEATTAFDPPPPAAFLFIFFAR